MACHGWIVMSVPWIYFFPKTIVRRQEEIEEKEVEKREKRLKRMGVSPPFIPLGSVFSSYVCNCYQNRQWKEINGQENQ